MSAAHEFTRPFPALTPAQRYHFDAYGYVVIEQAIDADLCGRLLDAMHQLDHDLEAAGDHGNAVVRGCRYSSFAHHHRHFAHILEADPAILDYLAHPYLVGMAEEVVGGSVRLEESEAVVNRRDPGADLSEPPKFGFHTGTRPEHGTYTQNGLFHCNFVKTLTNLTDLGPDDGGTVVVAGSHKMNAHHEDIIAAAYEDRSLIHQVVAPAGSTLLFAESLIHATGRIESDRERVIVIGGYTPTMFQAWNGQEPSAEFVERAPEHLRPLLSGSDRWSWKQKYREHLGDAAQKQIARNNPA